MVTNSYIIIWIDDHFKVTPPFRRKETLQIQSHLADDIVDPTDKCTVITRTVRKYITTWAETLTP
jgi:hypothetical protein